MPEYNLEDFVGACRDGGAVFVSRAAQLTARSDFGLNTRADVLDFIGSGGLEDPRHTRTAIWENNRTPNKVVWVDSYSFYSGNTYGYLAFVYAVTDQWIIKSLKRNDQPDPRFRTMALALTKAGRNK